jgi:hypothetical protein
MRARVGVKHRRAVTSPVRVSLAIALLACGTAEPPPPPRSQIALAANSTAAAHGEPLRDVSTLGAFAARDVKESSAAVRSFSHPGVYWTLNDSGNDARLFAFDSAGRDLGAVRVTGARNRDWEAMATGPCATGRCLYVGDVGDNMARHDAVVIWRVPEPAPPGPNTRAESEPAERLAVRYPDGPRDVEAMWMDADTVLWLATKRPMRDANNARRPALVYRVPAEAWRAGATHTAVAELVDSLPIVPRNERTMVTDAAMSNPFGDPTADSLLAVRAYRELLVLRVSRTSGRPLVLVARCDLEPLRETQGEGVAWLPDGRLMLTSEKRFAPLRAVRCP